MRQEEVDQCQIQEWYPKFMLVSIKMYIHRLLESFVQYLLGDSEPFVLPSFVMGEDVLPNRVCNPVDQDDLVVPEGSGDDSEEFPPPSFP